MEVPNPKTSNDPFIIPPSSPHTHSAIILHSRRDHGYTFGTLLAAAQTSTGKTLPQVFPGTKFIFPTAKPRRSAIMSRIAGGSTAEVTLNQWFDDCSLLDLSKRQDLQREGLRESSAIIHRLIRDEAALVGLQNVVLGGLRQGCAMALHVLLSFQPEEAEKDGAALGAFVGMSGWLPFERDILEAAWPESRDAAAGEDFFFVSTPGMLPTRQMLAANLVRDVVGLPPLDPEIEQPAFARCRCFFGHGIADDVIAIRLGADARNTLYGLGVPVMLRVYEGPGHWWKEPEGIDDIMYFLTGEGETGELFAILTG